MSKRYAQLVVDEELFLTAIKFLNNQTEKHELLNVVGDFAQEPYLSSRFCVDVDREMGDEERRAIEDYVRGVYLVSHHNFSIEDIGDVVEEFEGPALDFIRQAAWAFLTAWAQRYGGTHTRLRVNQSTLIDPDR